MPLQKDWSKKNLTRRQAELARREWLIEGRLSQLPPDGDWHGWMVVGGRGSGKTRAGAEWISAQVRSLPGFGGPARNIALVGETLADVRDVMVEGPSGLLAVARGPRARFEVSRRRVVWDNGAVAMMFSSEDPDSLRGPQFDAAWCDELCKWRNADATFDMLQFGMRLGVGPRQVVTTTPRPTPLFKRLLADPAFVTTRMKTSDNAANLARGFVQAVERRYGGTRLGRQELDGELVEDRDGALWSRAMIEASRGALPDEFVRVVVAVDPPVTSGKGSDACGIVAAGLDREGRGWVIEDASLARATPARWGERAIALYHRLCADALIVEVNQGGDLVTGVITGIDQTVRVKPVRASRGKAARAEPVAAFYEQGRVRHACAMPELEDEMCDFGPGGLSGSRSPDRVDALVWALTDLLLSPRGQPRIRTVG